MPWRVSTSHLHNYSALNLCATRACASSELASPREGGDSHPAREHRTFVRESGGADRAAAVQNTVIPGTRKLSSGTGYYEWLLVFRFISLGGVSNQIFKAISTFADKVHMTNMDSSYKTERIQVCHIFFSAKDLNIMWL